MVSHSCHSHLTVPLLTFVHILSKNMGEEVGGGEEGGGWGLQGSPPQGLVYVVLLILYAVGNNTFLHQLYIYHFPSKEHGKHPLYLKKSNLCLGCHQQKTQKEEKEKAKLCSYRGHWS
jgi:hypothetical protein